MVVINISIALLFAQISLQEEECLLHGANTHWRRLVLHMLESCKNPCVILGVTNNSVHNTAYLSLNGKSFSNQVNDNFSPIWTSYTSVEEMLRTKLYKRVHFLGSSMTPEARLTWFLILKQLWTLHFILKLRERSTNSSLAE